MSKVKTLFLFEEIPENVRMFELEGDYSHLNLVYINGTTESYNKQTRKCLSNDDHNRLCDELNNLVYDDEGNTKVTFIDKPTKDWTHFVKCGFFL